MVSETFFPPRGFPAVQCLSPPSTMTTHRAFCRRQTGRRRDHQGRCFVRQDASDPVELPVRGFSSSQCDGPGTPSGVTHTHADAGRRLEGRVCAVGLGGCCWKGRREGPAAACRPSSVVVPTCQDPQYRTAAAARKSASLHRDVQKPKDRQQQQQGKVPECRLWLTGMAMSGRRSSLNCLGRLSSSTSSPDAAEGCQELQLLGAELHPVADAILRAWRRRVTLGNLHSSKVGSLAAAVVRVRGDDIGGQSQVPAVWIFCSLAGSVSVRILNGNRRWCCLLPDACWDWLGFPLWSGIHPVTFQNASLAADPPWPPCCEEGLFGALS